MGQPTAADLLTDRNPHNCTDLFATEGAAVDHNHTDELLRFERLGLHVRKRALQCANCAAESVGREGAALPSKGLAMLDEVPPGHV